MSNHSVQPSEGWGVVHTFFHLRRDLLADTQEAGRDFAARVRAFDARDGYQALCFAVLGQKADFGVLILGPDLAALDSFGVEVAASPLGGGLVPAASYVSLTELSEYMPDDRQESDRLTEQEGLVEGSSEHAEALERFRERLRDYAEHRLHPRLPRRRVLSFYPMSKRRDRDANWYELDFEDRRQLMAGHAAVGRRFKGRVLQLVTGSVGLDDWEWGVTLLADDPKAIRDIVYEMRFDEVSARFAEFGPFVTGLVMEPEHLVRHLGLT